MIDRLPFWVLFYALCISCVQAQEINSQHPDNSASNNASELSVDESVATKPVPLDLQWRRAIDRDDGDKLWQLMALVDINATNDKGKNALMSAAKLGDRQLLDALVRLGLVLDDRSLTGGTVLMYAVLGNELEMIDYLLSYKPNLDAQSTNGWTAAMIAAAKGFDQALVRLVDAGADADLADVYLWSPLMRAIDNRHSKVIRLLLELPTPALDHANENGSTALHIAAQQGDSTTVEQLLANGASVAVLDKNRASAQQVAQQNGHVELAKIISRSE